MIRHALALTCLMAALPVAARAGDDGDYAQLEEGQVAPEGWATVKFDTDHDKMRVSTVLGSSVGYAAGTTVYATTYQSLCLTPCVLAIKPGLRDFVVGGQGRTPAGISLDLRPNSAHSVVGKTGPVGARLGGIMLVSLGLSGLLTGGTLVGVDAAVGGTTSGPGGKSLIRQIGMPMLIGGGASTVLGIPLIIVGRSRLTEE